MNESRRIEKLLDSYTKQTYPFKRLYVCINQPDSWWKNTEKQHICHDNKITLELLQKTSVADITVIDRSSEGYGWKEKNHGVGWARKTAMDAINAVARADDLIVSIDADTWYPPGYLASLAENANRNPDAAGFAIPYYHPLNGEEATDRAILRYEIYMRYYALNLWRTKIPYRFTAVGSAMAAPVWAYRKIGGITPHLSGEDFYFLLKLSKTGRIVTWNHEKAYPAARFSDRVFFGTGPAMIKGNMGDWDSYPFYDPQQFDLIAETFRKLPEMFDSNIDNQFIDFLNHLFKTGDLFAPLRKTHREKTRFVRAATERIDALRILQYLRYAGIISKKREEQIVTDYLHLYHGDISSPEFSFAESPVDGLNRIRDILVNIETRYQQNEWNSQS